MGQLDVKSPHARRAVKARVAARARHFPISSKIANLRAAAWRDTAAERMTPAQIAEAQKLAREWRPRGEQAE
jgi:hypothetical protein